MNRIVKCIGIAVVIASGVWLWLFLFPNPKQVIRNRIHKVAELASFTSGSGNISGAVKLQHLGGYFTEDAIVVIDIPGVASQTFNKSELMQSGMAMRSVARGLKVELLDLDIELANGSDTALVDLTLKAKVGGDSDLIWQELKFTMKKINADWLISRVETVKTLKP